MHTQNRQGSETTNERRRRPPRRSDRQPLRRGIFLPTHSRRHHPADALPRRLLLAVVGTKVSSPPSPSFRHFINKNQNTITMTAMTNSAKIASSVGLG